MLFLPVLIACNNNDDDNDNSTDQKPDITTPITISSLRFIGEQIIPDTQQLNGVTIGGLSSIDYSNGVYYLISDATEAPIRFYTASLDFDLSSFSSVNITSQVELLETDGSSFSTFVDPESLRVDGERVVWVSEGSVNDAINPLVRSANLNGEFVRSFNTPTLFNPSSIEAIGPRHNGVFESLSLDINGNGYWVGMELPLEQDGPEPIFMTDTESPVRVSFLNATTGNFERQFAYELDKVQREIIGTGFNFTVNGLVELLQYDTNKFLALERSFTTGADDGGNDVKIYDVDISNATDISSISALSSATFTRATKKLLFNFETIREQLTTINGTPVVDNIEGITFGPELSNGHKSLIVVADNNFSAFGPQLNQFIAFEVIPITN